MLNEKISEIKPRLRWLDNSANVEPINLRLGEGESFTFGRDPSCDLPIEDNAVSRSHCRIIYKDDEFRVEDLKSHNGTLVNNSPVSASRLRHRDQIRIGNAQFVFLVGENDEMPISEIQFDDGSLNTNSIIQLFPKNAAGSFSTDLNILVKLGKAVNEIKNFEPLQKKILEIILSFVPARHGAILLTGEDLEEPQAVSVSAKNYSDTAPIKISRTVSERVLREQIALLSRDLSDKNLDQAESLIALRVTSLICVPLKIGDKKGLIYLDTIDVDVRLTEKHLEQITAVSFLISAVLENAASLEGLRQENALLKDTLQIETNMIGESPQIEEIFRLIGKVAPLHTTILITGESGTGKELVAKTIYKNSLRKNQPFVTINCGALSEHLLESELFGHEKGSFTGAIAEKKGLFEIADNGTIFLDEIGDLDLSLQVKLLRLIQEKEFLRVGGTKTRRVNVRIIAATNQNLETAIKDGKFREDLFFRLNVVPIKVPPLRERKSDIMLLAQHFIGKYSEECHRKVVGLSTEARRILLAHKWKGNIRELGNVIEHAVALGSTDEILPEDLPSEMVSPPLPELNFNGSYNEQMKYAKQKIVISALQNSRENHKDAAQKLGIHPNNLYRIIRELDIKDDLRTLDDEDS